MSTVSEARWRDDRWLSLDEDEEECRDEDELLLLLDFDEEEEDLCEDEEEDLREDFSDLSVGTSRMFSSRPVVGSVVESTLGLWATW